MVKGYRDNPSHYESLIGDPDLKPKKVGTRIAKILRKISPRPKKVSVRKADAGWPRGWDFGLHIVLDIESKDGSVTGVSFSINVAQGEASGTASADLVGLIATKRGQDAFSVIDGLSNDVKRHFTDLKRNPHEIPLCPVCGKPAHAFESDDLDRHPECQPPGERWQPEMTYRGVAYPPEGMTGNPYGVPPKLELEKVTTGELKGWYAKANKPVYGLPSGPFRTKRDAKIVGEFRIREERQDKRSWISVDEILKREKAMRTSNPSEIHFDGSTPKLSSKKVIEFLEESLDMNERDAKVAAGMMRDSEAGKQVWGERYGREYRMSDSDILRWINDHADDGHGLHGVEAIFEGDDGELNHSYGSILAEYINTGDTYSPTVLIESVGRSVFYLTTYGDWIEKQERE